LYHAVCGIYHCCQTKTELPRHLVKAQSGGGGLAETKHLLGYSYPRKPRGHGGAGDSGGTQERSTREDGGLQLNSEMHWPDAAAPLADQRISEFNQRGTS
jgi:hypothetical protein